MKQGKSLVDLARALEHARTNAKDFVVPAAKLEAVVIPGTAPAAALATRPDLVQAGATADTIALSFDQGTTPLRSTLNNWSHGQLAQYTDSPKATPSWRPAGLSRACLRQRLRGPRLPRPGSVAKERPRGKPRGPAMVFD